MWRMARIKNGVGVFFQHSQASARFSSFSPVTGRVVDAMVSRRICGNSDRERTMAESSFDVVSKVNMEEVRNAVEQAQREIANRFDFKNSVSSIEVDKEALKLHSDDEFKMKQL